MNIEDKYKIEIPISDPVWPTVLATVVLAKNKKPIVAFARLEIYSLVIKGITIKEKTFGKENTVPVLCMDLPAYRTGPVFTKSVYFTNKRIYVEISTAIVEAVQKWVKEFENKNEDINPEEVPI